MASRESQGLQISLILFVMVSVVLAVMTFVFYRSSEGAKSSLAAEKKQKEDLRTLADTESFKVQYLQHVLGAVPLADAQLSVVHRGIATDAQIVAIDEAYKTDMATYGEGLPPEKRTYRDLPLYMLMALNKKNKDYSELQTQFRTLNNEKAELEKNERARTEVAHKGQQEAGDQLQQQTEAHRNSLQAVEKMRADDLSGFQQKMNKLNEEINNKAQLAEEESAKRRQSETTIETQKKRIASLVDQPFEVPDGKILWVSQSTKHVWINLGTADGLRRQTTFSVFDQEAMNIAPQSKFEDDDEGGLARQADTSKAKIEITVVHEAHLAEGRIVEDTAANPIMPGDQIFSPAWKPGRRVRFALAGVMDLDGDKRSDMELLRSIITMGGGAVDEAPDAGTRYLVLGDQPIERVAMAEFGETIEKASTLGIQSISLPILLDLLGYKAEVSTMKFNKPREKQRSEFRERRPEDSAF